VSDVEFRGLLSDAESRTSSLCNVPFTASRFEQGRKNLLKEGTGTAVSESLPPLASFSTEATLESKKMIK
jgi:hypothetical protein